MEEVDRNLDQMGTLLTGLNSMAVVSDSATPSSRHISFSTVVAIQKRY